MTEETSCPLWAKCAECSHTWIAVYLPQTIQTFCKIVGRQVCPKCGGRAVIAKQADGELLEDAGDG